MAKYVTMAITFIAIAFFLQFSSNNSDFLTPSKGQKEHSFQKNTQHTSTKRKKSNRSSSNHDKWSQTSPAINLPHVFEGEINRKGKPVGFHARPNGEDPRQAKIISIKDGPNQVGVYTATIQIKDGSHWKTKFSSFFPDTLSKQQVIDAIIHAYNKSPNKKKQPWRGPSGLGFDVQGYTLSRGDINTAFPIYRK